MFKIACFSNYLAGVYFEVFEDIIDGFRIKLWKVESSSGSISNDLIITFSDVKFDTLYVMCDCLWYFHFLNARP